MNHINRPTEEQELKIMEVFPEKPVEHEYGYIGLGNMVGCSREKLIKKCGQNTFSPIELVWIPDAPRLLLTEEVPFLHNALIRRAKVVPKIIIILSSFLLIILIFWYLFLSTANPNNHDNNVLPGLLFFASFPILGLLIGVIALWRVRVLTPEYFAKKTATIRETTWLIARRPQRKGSFSHLIVICILAVGVAQLIAGGQTSIESAGLMKDAVWRGENMASINWSDAAW